MKRIRLRFFHSGIVAIFLVIFLVLSESSYGKPMRAIWVVRHNLVSPADIRRVFDVSVHCGITDVFVQVRGRGDAYYRSSFVPAAENIDRGFDPLDYCLKLGRQHRIRVHAWMNVYLLWSASSPPVSRNHPILAHPDWVAQTPAAASKPPQSLFPFRIAPGTEGAYLSPGNQEARRYLVRAVTELASKYPVDGIHFDYIRYPNRDYDYSFAMRKRFHEESGADPFVLFTQPQEVIRLYGNSSFRQFEDLWVKFRQEQIRQFLIDVKNALPRRKPPYIISAAVKPEPETAQRVYYQNWMQWLKERLIDIALPMNYSRSIEEFERRVRAMLSETTPDRLCVGVGLYNQSKYRVVSKIYKLRALGIRNFCLFSYDTLHKDSNLLEYIASLP